MNLFLVEGVTFGFNGYQVTYSVSEAPPEEDDDTNSNTGSNNGDGSSGENSESSADPTALTAKVSNLDSDGTLTIKFSDSVDVSGFTLGEITNSFNFEIIKTQENIDIEWECTEINSEEIIFVITLSDYSSLNLREVIK